MARLRRRNYSYSEKKLVLEKFLLSSDYASMSVKQFSRICGINYWTLLSWGNAIEWEIGRIEELKRKKRKKAPGGQSGLSEVIGESIVKIATLHKSWGPLKIKQYLWRHEQILLPQTSIYRFMKERGLVNERKKGDEKAAHDRSFEYASPLSGVQMDLMHVMLSNGQAIHLVTLLDDYSRYVVASRFIAVKTMDEVIDVFSEAVRTFGVMDSLLTDCGSEFVSWQAFTRFEALLSDLDVRYIASGPDKKENQGKVERWHQTVRQELRLRGPLDHSSEAQLWIRDLRDMYNYERPHQGIGGLVPADRFFGMGEEIEAELERFHVNERRDQKIYFMCRVGERKLVVSGPRADDLSVLLDGKSLTRLSARVFDRGEESQLEEKSSLSTSKDGFIKEHSVDRGIEAD